MISAGCQPSGQQRPEETAHRSNYNCRVSSDPHLPNASLLVFADDWGRHPSSIQHLIRPLLSCHPTLWVNTIGMRPPKLNVETLQRGLEKCRQWAARCSQPATIPENLRVTSPRMWPWFTRRLDRALNRRLLSQQIKRELLKVPDPIVAVTTLPIVADLMDELPVVRWVYYCVDDFSRWPGLDQQTLQRMESEVIARADVLIAAGTQLHDRLRQQRDSVELLTHGVDLDHWQRAAPKESCEDLLADCEAPLIVFWGLIDRRMDVSFLQSLSARLTRGSILLVGPESDPDPALLRIPKVRRISAVPYDQLPDIAQRADVLVMPYADLPVSRAMQPLKMLEYLATGKPVVARALPATSEWADCLDVAATADEFSALVHRRIDTGTPEGQRRARTRLQAESWQSKSQHFEALIREATCDAR